ncbi:MAG: hypothetical protein KJP15_11780 [Gammaproteobacteria bacterium]|nr:hypothetical protein [Gammaproteobacteria bacterium]
MKTCHSKSSFRLLSFVASAAFLISCSGAIYASVPGNDGNGASPTTPPLVSAGDGFVLDGYKSIKFGMNVIELKSMGYKCPNYSKTICRLDHAARHNETSLGKEANLMVWVDQNKVRRIDVSIEIKPKDMLNYFKESLGEPVIYRYISLTNNLIEAYYWVSTNGSSVSLTRDFGKITTTTDEAVEKASSTMKYQNEQLTLKSIESMKQRELPTENTKIGHR